MRSTLLTLALLGATRAQALQPEGLAVAPGIEPQRVFRDHPQVQARLATDPRFQDFLAEHPDWTARFDEVTGAPWRLAGGPIPMPAGEAELVEALRALLDRHADLLRFEPGTLELRQARYEERVDTWYVDFDAPRQGAPIWRGGITARVKHGNLVMLGALAYGDRPARGAWTLGPDEAIARAVAQGPLPRLDHADTSAERVWLPVQGRGGLELVATWLVRSRTDKVPGHWVSFVHAETGRLLSVHNEVRFFDGAVTGWHHARTVSDPLVQSPLPLAVVSDGTDVVVAGEDGSFSLPDGGAWVTDLRGDYARVDHATGEDGVLDGTGDLDWTTAAATSTGPPPRRPRPRSAATCSSTTCARGVSRSRPRSTWCRARCAAT